MPTPTTPKPPSESRFTPLDLKTIAADGVFEGYASLFNREDLGRDIVLPGAFAETLRARGAAGVKMLYQHDPAEPIGVWETIVEDARGLFVRGRLMAGVARAREVLALMRAGAIDGLSIGFKAVRARRDRPKGVRKIEAVDLWEISIVTFPMLPEARVSAVLTPRRAPAPLSAHGLLAEIAGATERLRLRLDRHCREPAVTSTALSASLAGEQALIALMRIGLLEHKRFNPGQPRVPAGSPDGGRWTGGDGGEVDNANLIHLINGGRRGSRPVRVGNQVFEATPEQASRLDRARSNAEGAIRRAREIDPTWQPRPAVRPQFRSIEDSIREREDVAREADARLAELRQRAIPDANLSWGLNRLTKELHDRGFILKREARGDGFVYSESGSTAEVRIMDRPPGSVRSREDPEKYYFNHYYRFRPGDDKPWGKVTPIPDK